MFRVLALSIPLAAGACVGNSAVPPGKLPPGANAGVYITADVQAVASCIAAALRTTPEVQGDRIVVAAPGDVGLRYSVGPNGKGKGVYHTQVAIIGVEQDAAQTARVQVCFAPPTTG
ncbi:hypothetical protein [Sphingomonas hengshuiensis]|uniref:hypothetical protein n=1 Tax=Sphingomonas hengshuiensis TaxID=1609977 RepID=UPI000A6D6147|nr:hypothetical protein [Sphingomonas hengshuiensis]